MTVENEQSTADTEPQNSGNEAEEALDWEAVLNEATEAESERQTSTPPQEDQSPDEMAALRKQVEDLAKQQQQREFNDEIAAATSTVKGDLDMPDKHVRALVIGRVSDDPKAMQAYMDRHDNPTRWQKLLGALHSEVAKDFGGKSETTGDDVESVEALVRNNQAPPPQDSTFDVAKAARLLDAGDYAGYNAMVNDH